MAEFKNDESTHKLAGICIWFFRVLQWMVALPLFGIAATAFAKRETVSVGLIYAAAALLLVGSEWILRYFESKRK